jgi:hypothetical protein
MRLSLRKRIFESGFRLIEKQMLRVNTKRQIQQKSLFRLVCELGPPEGQDFLFHFKDSQWTFLPIKFHWLSMAMTSRNLLLHTISRLESTPAC